MNRYTKAVMLAGAMALPIHASAMSPDRLRAALEQGQAERVVVIDIRALGAFRAGHIAGAMRLPVAGLEGRHVPPFGRVVVVWDGIDEAAARRVLAALNAKPGIDAQLLDGGYPAWASAGGREVGERQVPRAQVPGVTWEQLMRLADNPDLVVLDLRHSPRRKPAAPADDRPALTDLAALLPNARIVAPQREQRRDMKRAQQSAQGLDRQGVRKRSVPGWLRGQRLDKGSIYVLVDAGDGQLSERVARRLAARGMKRVYMLLGGERTLVTRGESQPVTLTTVPPDGAGQ